MGLTQDHAGGTKWWNAAAKPCDYCGSGAAILFCRVESAFMCMSCDAKAHNADDKLAAPIKHARVWMCEVCEQAPAAVTCKADAAALCLACDQDIHSVNPLARRHERAAVVPFYDTAESMVMKSTAAMFADEIADRKVNTYVQDSWVSSNAIIPAKIPAETPPEIKSMELLFSDSDQLLDFDNYQFCSQPYSDSIVPVQTTVKPAVSVQSTHRNSPENRFEIDFTRSNITSNSNSYTAASLSHSVSSSSLDVGVVPDGGSISEISYPFSTTMNSSIETRSNQTSQVVGMDREARVLRYKEKRKNRKFEKTIRYASRKAYAETRPRIKGRFAKRTDSESDIDGIYSFFAGNLVADSRYGVVPSF